MTSNGWLFSMILKRIWASSIQILAIWEISALVQRHWFVGNKKISWEHIYPLSFFCGSDLSSLPTPSLSSYIHRKQLLFQGYTSQDTCVCACVSEEEKKLWSIMPSVCYKSSISDSSSHMHTSGACSAQCSCIRTHSHTHTHTQI